MRNLTHLLWPLRALWGDVRPSLLGYRFGLAAVVFALALLALALRRVRAYRDWQQGIARGSRERDPSPSVHAEWASGLVLFYLLASATLQMPGRETLTWREMSRLPMHISQHCEGLASLARAGGLAMTLATVAYALAAGCRARGERPPSGARTPGAAAVFLVLAVLPVSAAIAHYAVVVDPWGSASAVRATAAELGAARHLLVGAFTVAGLAVVAAVAMGSSRAARPWSRRALVLVTLAAGAGAAWLGWVSRPLAAELEAPLPSGYPWHGDLGCACITGPPFPEGEGPDELMEAPQLTVHGDRAQIDGVAANTAEDVHASLQAKRELWREVQPEKRFPGVVVAAFYPGTSVARVAEILGVLQRPALEVRLVLIGLTRQIDVERPFIGSLHGEGTTALRVWLTPRADAVTVDVAAFPRVADWIAALLAERRRGHEVAIGFRE